MRWFRLVELMAAQVGTCYFWSTCAPRSWQPHFPCSQAVLLLILLPSDLSFTTELGYCHWFRTLGFQYLIFLGYNTASFCVFFLSFFLFLLICAMFNVLYSCFMFVCGQWHLCFAIFLNELRCVETECRLHGEYIFLLKKRKITVKKNIG